MTSELTHITNLIKSKNEKVENICYKEVHKIKLDKRDGTVVSHIYAYDRAKTLSFILLIRRKSTEFENESNV